MPPKNRYRLYLDEAGDHTRSLAETDPVGRRYLCLLGVIVMMGEHYTSLQNSVEVAKRAYLPYDPDEPPILHREDILNKRKAFYVLQDAAHQEAFNGELITLINGAPITIIGVVLDKFTHGKKTYRSLSHAYHYCLAAMLERYCGLLDLMGTVGDVMAEARGKTEDRALAQEYRSIWENGTNYMPSAQTQKTLTTKELKIRPKTANIAGLQVADILAHPVKRDVLFRREIIPTRGGAFADRIIEAVTGKYNRQRYTGEVGGYGRIFLS